MCRYPWRFAGVLAFVLLAFGSVGESVAQGPQQLRVGSGIDPSQGLWLIAQEKGFAAKHQLDLNIKTFESGTFALEAVAAGDLIGAGSNGALPTLGGRAKGGRYVGVARALTAPHFMCAVVTDAIKKPKDLDGKTIGVLPASSSQFYWGKYSQFHKIEGAKTIRVAPPEMVTALRSGQVDAFFIWEPWCMRATSIVPGTRILAYGGENNIFIAADQMISFSESFIKEQPETALRLLRALYDAADWVKANPKEAAQIFAKAYRGKPEEFIAITEQMNWGLRLDGSVYDVFYDVAAWMKQTGLISVPDTNALVDGYLYPDILVKIDPSRVGKK
jgi:ABC-type nitrate/sulfonate/bicarbonate transport system substrate-binding protein